MATLSELQVRLERLQEIRAKGVREIEFSTSAGNRRLVFSSVADLDSAIASVQRQIAAASGSRVDTVVFSTSKGISG